MFFFLCVEKKVVIYRYSNWFYDFFYYMFLHLQGLNVELCPSLFEEDLEIDQFPTFAAFVEETALHKVLEVSERLDAQEKEGGDRQRPDIIIGADTMVTLDNQMYGKPTTKENAIETLRK